MNTKRFNWQNIKNLIVRNGTCHARVQMRGKEYWRSLHIDADPEGKNAPDAKEALRAFKLELAKNTHAILQLTRSRNEYSTLGDLFTAYREVSKGRDIGAKTVENNITWLKLIITTTQGEFTKAEECRASLFNSDEILRTFQSKRIAAIKAKAIAEKWTAEEAEQRMKSGKNTIKSIVSQGRSVLARELLQSRDYRALVLPPLDQFLSYKMEGSSVAAFVRPPAELWQKIVDDVPALRTTDLARWYAFQLGINCGLRRGSARNARWAWCKELATGEAEMEVKRAKGGHYTIRLPAGLWTDLKEAKSSTDYIIPRATEEERNEAIDEVVDWLRGHGMTVDEVRQPFHTLRKLFGNAVKEEHGLTEAQNALGHSKQDLTHAVYSEHRSTKGSRVV